MKQTDDVLRLIRERYAGLSKGQKRLADYISDHYDRALYQTAAKLGIEVGVSESTVVRFAIELGYEGYPELQKALEKLVKNRLTALQRIEVSNERLNREHILPSVLHADMENLKETWATVDEAQFDEAVERIKGAKRVYILGVRSCAALAGFMGFYFNFLLDDVKLIHTNSVSETFEQVLGIGEGDVFIGISFPRYSKRTSRVMEFAKSRGASCIAITDSELSPLVELSDCVLMCRSNMISFADSLVAPLSVINALIASLSYEKEPEIKASLKELESIWMKYDVYSNEQEAAGRGSGL